MFFNSTRVSRKTAPFVLAFVLAFCTRFYTDHLAWRAASDWVDWIFDDGVKLKSFIEGLQFNTLITITITTTITIKIIIIPFNNS